MLKESSEDKQNNSAEKISMNGSLWAERCPAPCCCIKRKKAEGTVILPLRPGAAGSRHVSWLCTPGCKEQGSWELRVLAENPKKQQSKSREKMLPWCILVRFLVEPLTQEEGCPSPSQHLQRVCRADALHSKLPRASAQAFEVHHA